MSLWQQSFKAFDILIVDDASSPAVMMQELFLKIMERLIDDGHDVRVKRFDTNNGIAKNRSLLLNQLKRYKYVLDLNDDHFLESCAVYNMKSYLDEHPDVGAVGSATPFFFDKLKDRIEYYSLGMPINIIHTTSNGDKKEIFMTRKVDKVFLNSDGKLCFEPIEVKHMSQFMYRPELIDELPQDYSVLGFSEETDLSLRIRKAGKKLIFLPYVINWHLQSGNGGIREHYGMRKKEMVEADNNIFVNNWWGWLSEQEKNKKQD